MKRVKAVLALFVILAVFTMFTIAPAFVAILQDNHLCCGDNCCVCRTAAVFKDQKLSVSGLQVLFSALAVFFVITNIRLIPSDIEYRTPVSLNTELLN